MAKTLSAYTSFVESASGGRALKHAADGRGHRTFRNVTIIKAGLGNKRDKHFYPGDTLRDAVDAGLFEGLKAYVDHPTALDAQVQPERTLRDFAGLYEKARFLEDSGGARVVADLHILPAYRWLADSIESLVSLGHGDKIGISINGRGTTAPDRMVLSEGEEPVEVFRVKKFTALPSADLVTEAGAGGGFQQLMESATGAASRVQHHGVKDMKATIQKDLAALIESGKIDPESLKALLEAHPEQTDADPGDEDADDDADVAEADDTDDDADDDADGDDADGDDTDDMTEAGDDADCGCGGKVREAGAVRGMPKGGGKGMATKTAKGKSVGRKFGEANAAVRRLEAENGRLRARVERLSEAVGLHDKSRRIAKLLKESKLPPAVHGPLAKRLLRLSSEAEIRDEISFQRSLLESAADAVAADLGFDEIEGAGARFRESTGSTGDDHSLREAVGHRLPLKQKA